MGPVFHVLPKCMSRLLHGLLERDGDPPFSAVLLPAPCNADAMVGAYATAWTTERCTEREVSWCGCCLRPRGGGLSDRSCPSQPGLLLCEREITFILWIICHLEFSYVQPNLIPTNASHEVSGAHPTSPQRVIGSQVLAVLPEPPGTSLLSRSWIDGTAQRVQTWENIFQC